MIVTLHGTVKGASELVAVDGDQVFLLNGSAVHGHLTAGESQVSKIEKVEVGHDFRLDRVFGEEPVESGGWVGHGRDDVGERCLRSIS